MPSRRRSFLALTVPLALLGAATALLSGGAAHAPSVFMFPSAEARMGALCAALVFAAASTLVLPAASHEAWMAPRPTLARITLVVLCAGVLAAALAELFAGPGAHPFGPLTGLLTAIPLVPACALLIAATRRAAQARPGSVIARAERRARLSLVVTTLGVLAMTVPSICAAHTVAPPPQDARAITFAAALLVIAVLLGDLATWRRIERVASQLADQGSTLASETPLRGRIDFGVGDEARAAVAPRTTYRGGGREHALVLGNTDAARATLRGSLRRGAFALALLEVVSIGWGLSLDRVNAALYNTELCEAGVSTSCRAAALLTEQAGLPINDANRLHTLACTTGDEASCLAVALIHRSYGEHH